MLLRYEIEPASNTQPIFSQTVIEHCSLVTGDYIAGLAMDNWEGVTVRSQW